MPCEAMELTILIGMHAQRWHLGDRCKPTLTENVANWRDYWPAMLPLPHPSPRNTAWMGRNPFVERDLLPALRQRVRTLVD